MSKKYRAIDANIFDNKGNCLFTCGFDDTTEGIPIALELVRAVNNHQALVEALQHVVDWHNGDTDDGDWAKVIHHARTVLAKATE